MYYAVAAKCGHTGFGPGFFLTIVFAVQALSAKDAAKEVRSLPRVKHHRKDAIISVCEVDEAEYNRIRQKNQQDPYLCAHSIQEQRRAIPPSVMINRVQAEPIHVVRSRKHINEEHARFRIGKTIVENPHRFHHYQPDDRRLSRIILLASA